MATYHSSSSSTPTLSPPPPPPSPYLSIIESRLNTIESRLSTLEARLANPSPYAPHAPSFPSFPSPLIPIIPGAKAPAASYKFLYYDAGNNVLTLPDDTKQRAVFRISTRRGLEGVPGKTVVKLLPSGGTGGGGEDDDDVEVEGSLEGGIDWVNRRIGVGEVSKYLDEVKGKAGGFMSLQTEWTWRTGRYTVTLNHSKATMTWTVSRKERELAVYTPLKMNGASGVEFARLKFVVDDITNEERVFLLLILMFQDLQKPPIGAIQGAGMGDAGAVLGQVGVNVAANMVGNAAGQATANAVAGCCVVQ